MSLYDRITEGKKLIIPGGGKKKLLRWYEVEIRVKQDGKRSYVQFPIKTDDSKVAREKALEKAKARWPNADVKVKRYRERVAVTKTKTKKT